MSTKKRKAIAYGGVLLLLVATGCTTVPEVSAPAPAAQSTPPIVVQPPPPVPSPPPPPPPPDPKLVELESALGLYHDGDFTAAVRALQPLANDALLSNEKRLLALKTLAFAQCSTRAITACRQSFERAFRLDAAFDLLPTEQGHPIWGPQFNRARKTVMGR